MSTREILKAIRQEQSHDKSQNRLSLCRNPKGVLPPKLPDRNFGPRKSSNAELGSPPGPRRCVPGSRFRLTHRRTTCGQLSGTYQSGPERRRGKAFHRLTADAYQAGLDTHTACNPYGIPYYHPGYEYQTPVQLAAVNTDFSVFRQSHTGRRAVVLVNDEQDATAKQPFGCRQSG